MKVLRLIVAIVLLLCAMMTAAQLDDQIVSKAFPANITCQRNGAQRRIEREQADNPNLLVLIKSLYSYFT